MPTKSPPRGIMLLVIMEYILPFKFWTLVLVFPGALNFQIESLTYYRKSSLNSLLP